MCIEVYKQEFRFTLHTCTANFLASKYMSSTYSAPTTSKKNLEMAVLQNAASFLTS